MDALDLLSAREFMRQNCVLWYSESSDPDIGGAYANKLLAIPGNRFDPLKINHTGVYLTMCQGLRVAYLGVSAIIKCQPLFNKFFPSHVAPAASDFSQSPTTVAITATKNAFMLLSSFTLDLISKSPDRRSIIIIDIVSQIGTWITSSSSVFYDPTIHSIYFQFLSEIQSTNSMLRKTEYSSYIKNSNYAKEELG